MECDCGEFWCVDYDCPSYHTGDNCKSCNKYNHCEHCIMQSHGDTDCGTLSLQLRGFAPWDNEEEDW